MRRSIQFLLLACLLAICARAQTTVTATIVDPNGNAYANGTGSAYSVVASGQASITIAPSTLSAFGAYSAVMAAGSYVFTFCSAPTLLGVPVTTPAPKQVCFSSAPIAVSGGSQNITSQLSPAEIGPPLTVPVLTTNTFPVFENCVPDQTGNSFPQVTSLTNYFYSHWEFVFNTTTYIDCTVYIQTAAAGATIVVDVASADSTAGHTANIQTCDALIPASGGNFQVGALTCATAELFTTTSTAYSRTSLIFNVQSTLTNGGILIVKIGTSPTGTAPTADILIYPHFLL